VTALLSIGELAARTGLPVRTIRFYSDAGVVPPADRTDAGYRLYGPDAPARLGLVRTLRDLGVDLATIRRVLDRELSLGDVAAAHTAAVDAQIRVLRVQKAVLQAVARRGADPKELLTMHRLAQLSDAERRRIVSDFLDHVFGGLEVDPAFEARMRSAAPSLPDDPSPEQVDAWIELAELVQDADFRARIRSMSEQQASSPPAGDMQAVAALVSSRAGAALRAGVEPGSPAAESVVAELLPAFGGEDRHVLADRLAVGTDARAERYWQLLAIINGWPPVPATVPAWEWLIAALRSRPARP
jgi:DNA-binding transcriptional MerR regulator